MVSLRSPGSDGGAVPAAWVIVGLVVLVVAAVVGGVFALVRRLIVSLARRARSADR